MKGDEEFARILIQRELGRPVSISDDGSENSMYDLRIGTKEAPEVAIECVRAMNQEFAESWSAGPAKGAFRLSTLKNDWMVETRVDARIKLVKAEIATLLQRLEAAGIHHLNELWPHRDHSELIDDLERVGITSAHRVERSDPTGKVTLMLPGIGGAVDDDGTQIPQWISEFLNDNKQADVLHKLDISGASECHVFVPVGFSGAPFAVESYFSGDLENLPRDIPALPSPVDCVWLCGMGNKGIWWNGSEWKFFRTRDE
jgi:hypothetical protein